MNDPIGLIGQQARLQPPTTGQPPAQGAQATGPSFKDTLMEQIGEVNRMQAEAEKAAEDLATGRREDMAQVVMAQEKADIAFQMLLQVRNKMMDAYEEVKQIRV